MKEIYCTARFLAKNGFKDNLVNALASLIPETTNEAGCLQYELTEEITYSGSDGVCWDICLIERWYSREDFEAHCNKSYIKHFFDVTAKDYVERADVRLYSPLSV
ncbi:MAG: putative quinol monooxygenase [Enterobacterales bacterium endosymbiont of Blomia tropicalis]|uniref:putative quinol monooxygenase n=1 Tax=Mixta mediterraneensis TaxID=2758443 RepID=UPI0025A6C7F8|nr:putative quinol monooxygenase [Mixta mediterraneensis]MDL4916056.1 putative quinol monooxygenase [Mixta mediterraneensis]